MKTRIILKHRIIPLVIEDYKNCNLTYGSILLHKLTNLMILLRLIILKNNYNKNNVLLIILSNKKIL